VSGNLDRFRSAHMLGGEGDIFQTLKASMVCCNIILKITPIQPLFLYLYYYI